MTVSAHCVYSPMVDPSRSGPSGEAITSGCWVHNHTDPCPHNGAAPNRILHAFTSTDWWQLRTHGQVPLLRHNGRLADMARHDTGDHAWTCWCRPVLHQATSCGCTVTYAEAPTAGGRR
jgi:hypothetical protein